MTQALERMHRIACAVVSRALAQRDQDPQPADRYPPTVVEWDTLRREIREILARRCPACGR